MSRMTPTEVKALSDYKTKVLDENKAICEPFSNVEDRFHLSTGKMLSEASEMTQKVIRAAYGQMAERKMYKGVYIYGGVGCGKTTISNVLSVAGNYRVVSSIEIAKEYSINGDKGIEQYVSGNICLDDLGAEERAYGKDILGMVIQARYDRWKAAQMRVTLAERSLDRIIDLGRDKGYHLVDWERLKASDDDFNGKVSWRFDVRDADARISDAKDYVPITHITSNVKIDEQSLRYSERVSSRIFEMCYFMDMSSEKDHRC